jgi:gas vesicle protein GvpA/GvpJ/GvpM family
MSTPAHSSGRLPQTMGGGRPPAQLADVLERVLDKGIVIAGDIQINLLDIELLTIRLRLLVASADKARELGIDWWEGDPFLGRGRGSELEDRLKRLEAATGLESGDGNEPARREEDEKRR